MLGEREALVVEVSHLDVHGVGYSDVTIAYRDRTVATARLGDESVPSGLQQGEEVLVATAMSTIVAIRRREAKA